MESRPVAGGWLPQANMDSDGWVSRPHLNPVTSAEPCYRGKTPGVVGTCRDVGIHLTTAREMELI